MNDPLSPEIIEVFQEGRPIWVFGYGSLMWDPGFTHVERVPARVSGWHRRFSLTSTIGWGTPEKPGLSAALHPGGSVLGVAFQIDAAQVTSALTALDRREVAYLRREVRMSLLDGHSVPALTYVAQPENGKYISGRNRDEQIPLIRQGNGIRGSSREYLERTVETLTEMGSRSSSAHDLLKFVRGLED